MTSRAEHGAWALGLLGAVALAGGGQHLAAGLCALCAAIAAWGMILRRRLHCEHVTRVLLEEALRGLDAAVARGKDVTPTTYDPADASSDAAGVLRLQERLLARLQQLQERTAVLEERHAQAAATEQSRSTFLADLCHEIRTPLNGLLGFLTMLADSARDDQQREWLATARSSGESLLALLDDMLDLAKIDAGKLALERVEFDRDELFESVAGLFAPTAQARGVEFLLDVDPNLPSRLVGDPVRLRQLVSNLVGNAVKFTTEGEIELSARTALRGGRSVLLEIVVADSGLGMDAAQVANLFQPFAQATPSTARRFGGTGLGLSIVKRIVEVMAGEIAVESQPRRGTRFRVRVPLGAGDPSPAAAAAAVSAPLVLVVDAHTRRRQLLEKTVRAFAADVRCAEDATAALAIVRAWSARTEPLVVLADDGVERDAGLMAAVRMRAESRLIVVRPPAAAYATLAEEVDSALVRPLRRAVLAAVIAGQARPGEAPRMADPEWSGRRVLLVEDNAVNQRFMCALLARMGVSVQIANDGQEAVDAVGHGSFDLILMDVKMPGMDGLTATRLIRALPAGSQLPILALTAAAQASDRDACLAAGMNDYLTKPVRAAALRAAMARFLPASATATA